MPARFLLIDGYNLLYAAGMGRATCGPGDLQRCRAELLRYLFSKLTPAEIARTTIIFDARLPPPDRPSRLVVSGLQVVFANPGGDADVVIAEFLAHHSAPRQLTLVSSDHELQAAARRHKAKFVDSDAFVDELERRRRTAATAAVGLPDAKEEGKLSAAQMEYWLKIFGDIPETAELSAGPAETQQTVTELEFWLTEFKDDDKLG